MSPVVDVVTVFHRPENEKLTWALQGRLDSEPEELEHTFTAVDNTDDNRGFAKACNLGARLGDSPYLAFLNPDLVLHGPILADGIREIRGDVVISGATFGMSKEHIAHWGCDDWVCGAAMFMERRWFESVGGFCEDYVWGFEETDLIRRAQAMGRSARSVELRCIHRSGEDDDATDRKYKQVHMSTGARIFAKRWRGEL